MKPQITIRKAKLDDIPTIYDLVRELAVFEKAENELLIDIPYYVQEFKKNTFSGIVAEIQGKVIGVCIYYMTYSTWKGRMLYLEDFVVKEAYRQHGIGQLLYDALLAEAKILEAKLVKWQVLDWNTPAVKFYEKNNAIIEKEWWNCKVIL